MSELHHLRTARDIYALLYKENGLKLYRTIRRRLSAMIEELENG